MKSSAKKIELASVDDLFSTEESRQDEQLEKIQEIPLWSIMQSTSSVCLIIRKSCAQAQHRQSIMPYETEKQSL